MNLSILHRPFGLTGMAGWPRSAWRSTPSSAGAESGSDLPRRLIMLHVAQATPLRPHAARPSWPSVAIACSALVALFAAAAGWQ